MLTAALWGLIQGLTEFLPVSSSGHLVLVPAIFGFDEPSLAASVMLHLGTLLAVVAYYRRDLLRLLHLRTDPEARRILMLLAVGTIPAALVGLTLEGPIETVLSEPWMVAVATDDLRRRPAVRAGRGPGRALPRRGPLDRRRGGGPGPGPRPPPGHLPLRDDHHRGHGPGLRAAPKPPATPSCSPSRRSPGPACSTGLDLARYGGFSWDLLVGMAVAAVVGYLAIAVLIKMLTRVGLLPFALYCLGAGAAAYFLV